MKKNNKHWILFFSTDSMEAIKMFFENSNLKNEKINDEINIFHFWIYFQKIKKNKNSQQKMKLFNINVTNFGINININIISFLYFKYYKIEEIISEDKIIRNISSRKRY